MFRSAFTSTITSTSLSNKNTFPATRHAFLCDFRNYDGSVLYCVSTPSPNQKHRGERVRGAHALRKRADSVAKQHRALTTQLSVVPVLHFTEYFRVRLVLCEPPAFAAVQAVQKRLVFARSGTSAPARHEPPSPPPL